jgi:hypothetical protein
LTITVVLSAAIVIAHSQTDRNSTGLAIDANRQFVYLKFDHMGRGIKRSDSEPELRIWFRFVNNSHFPIDLRTYGVPDGSPREEVGIMDFVAENPPMRIVITSDLDTKPKASLEPEKMPDDYWFEVGSGMTLQPGKEVLFSIPVNHLGKSWHMEIPFSFKNAGGKFPRDPSTGGEIKMRLSYSLYDLPDDVHAKIKSEVQ